MRSRRERTRWYVPVDSRKIAPRHADAALARHPRQAGDEGAEVGDGDVEPAVGAQGHRDDRLLGDERGGQRPVVVGADDVAHRPVGHQPADLAEVTGRRVAT